MSGKADLHLHTNYSDGSVGVQELLERAKAAGLTSLSITDHDSTEAIEEASLLGSQLGISIISGVELSASVGDQDVHILGYFFDHLDPRLQEHLRFFREQRISRAEKIVGKLNDLDISLGIDSVLGQAGHGSVGRPHVAQALVAEGHVGTYHEAFNKYLGYGKPAYQQKGQVTPEEVIKLISSSGGLSFIAHPGHFLDEALVMNLIRLGVDGIEVIHPSHSRERIDHYRGIVSGYFLLESGGSDFHGGRRNDWDALGKYFVPEEQVEMMRRRL